MAKVFMSLMSHARDGNTALKISPAKDVVVAAANPSVNASVIDVNSDFVFVSAGLNSKGAIPVAQFKNAEGVVTVQVGDLVEVDLSGVTAANLFKKTRSSRGKDSQNSISITKKGLKPLFCLAHNRWSQDYPARQENQIYEDQNFIDTMNMSELELDLFLEEEVPDHEAIMDRMTTLIHEDVE